MCPIFLKIFRKNKNESQKKFQKGWVLSTLGVFSGLRHRQLILKKCPIQSSPSRFRHCKRCHVTCRENKSRLKDEFRNECLRLILGCFLGRKIRLRTRKKTLRWKVLKFRRTRNSWIINYDYGFRREKCLVVWFLLNFYSQASAVKCCLRWRVVSENTIYFNLRFPAFSD